MAVFLHASCMRWSSPILRDRAPRARRVFAVGGHLMNQFRPARPAPFSSCRPIDATASSSPHPGQRAGSLPMQHIAHCIRRVGPCVVPMARRAISLRSRMRLTAMQRRGCGIRHARSAVAPISRIATGYPVIPSTSSVMSSEVETSLFVACRQHRSLDKLRCAAEMTGMGPLTAIDPISDIEPKPSSKRCA
jgi:hypothetical protein